MIECPWCGSSVILEHNCCPECKQEVLDEHLDPFVDDQENELEESDLELNEYDINNSIANSFTCTKCNHNECDINELAMTGAGLSKLLNIQYQHYLFVSCMQCGFVEIYDPTILRRRN
ncbi:zinc ribbon domain-containing protein [Paenibacillus sp. FSL A5-0031]|uniref:zinc ribbon domain-containing protein n=1 Tax=Paenibacillus sp. FSL A5-0031 TaxID=1920420 RepID=UPI0009FB6221|nr:zinc ribbon domain-containing protein [Paenibacillus sp. FSL A5-0031]